MDKNEMWEKCVAFHGHVCGGLVIGYKAVLYAIELLELNFKTQSNGCISTDEQIVCIAENDACGVDAVQSILGCSIGKGNLLFHMTGKQAFSFYNRTSGKSLRLVLKPRPEGMTRALSLKYYQGLEPQEMFDVKEARIALPTKASLFESYTCECCGEQAGANWIRIEGGKKVCLDCFGSYDRFHV